MVEAVTTSTPTAQSASPSPTPAAAQAAPSVASPSPTPTDPIPAAPIGDSFVKRDEPTAQAATPKAAKPDYIPDDLWDADKGFKSDRVKELLELDGRRGALPKSAAEYKPDLPDGVKLPEGAKIDLEDGRFKALQEIAHTEGWTQKAFSKALGIELKRVQDHDATIAAAIKTRNEALGPNGASRVDAITMFARTIAPTDRAADDIAKMLVTPGIIETFERIQTALGSQGIAALSRAPVTPAPDPKKIEGYEKMTFAQRLIAGEARKTAR